MRANLILLLLLLAGCFLMVFGTGFAGSVLPRLIEAGKHAPRPPECTDCRPAVVDAR